MKRINLWVMLLVFVLVIVCVFNCGKDSVDQRDLVLENDIFIKGHVLDIKVSSNHDFGILLLGIDSANVKEFDNKLKSGIYPYKIEGTKAEIYMYVPDGISNGDEVVVNSNDKRVLFYYVKSKRRSEGSLTVLTAGINMDYVKENSELK